MAKFKIVYNSAAKQPWHWRIVASNGEPICWSETYSTKANAEASIQWVKENARFLDEE